MVALAQELNYPKSESELQNILDGFFTKAKEDKELRRKPNFKGLLEIIQSNVVILTAIHNIKSNKGSQTAGADGETMQENILSKNYEETVERVKKSFTNYKPQLVRRVYIDKPGKDEKRSLGIPSIIDRIIQECVRIVIEPILEAQFFSHSYGFRPMRSAQMAIERTTDIVSKTGLHWVVEGDINKFFDTVNHRILIKKLWNMGIKDQRVLMIIKTMLEAGIMDEVTYNDLGTPQGGIISPLLANAYLDTLDQWIAREWEEKRTKHQYSTSSKRNRALRNGGNRFKPAYLVRYADDWILLTDSKLNAEKWKYRIVKYLKTNLKLKLSEEKTVITNIRKKPIRFLGFTYKLIKGKSKTGYVTNTKPDENRLRKKLHDIRKEIVALKKENDREKLIHKINLINSKIRGLHQYYECATYVNVIFNKYARHIYDATYWVTRKHGGKLVPANKVDNLRSVHQNYTTKIPAIKYGEQFIGFSHLCFVKHTIVKLKNQNETPYSVKGRNLYHNRTGKLTLLKIADELLNTTLSELIAYGKNNKRLYTFEYFLNRAYAFNRDKGKCRVCGMMVTTNQVNTHHINPALPDDKVNKVPNLATTHSFCHKMIHNNNDYSHLGQKIWKKILNFREKLA